MSAKTQPSSGQPSFSMEDFMAALDQQDFSAFEVGQTVRGKPFEYSSDGVLVDVGGKSAALLPMGETLAHDGETLRDQVPLGLEQEFLVVRAPNADGQVTISLRELALRKVWEELAALVESKGAVAVKVTGTNKGGVTVNVRGLRGFIPRSHLLEREELDRLIGQVLNVVPLEIDRDRKKLVFSHREAAKAGLMAQLKTGQLVTGRVGGIRPFGVFVDINGLRGLLHVKQMSQARVASVEELFTLGETVKAIVTDIDEWQGRISLSTAVLEAYRGEILEAKETVMAEAESRFLTLELANPEPVAPPVPSQPQAEEEPAAPAADAEPAPVAEPAETVEVVETVADAPKPDAPKPEAPKPEAPKIVALQPKPARQDEP